MRLEQLGGAVGRGVVEGDDAVHVRRQVAQQRRDVSPLVADGHEREQAHAPAEDRQAGGGQRRRAHPASVAHEGAAGEPELAVVVMSYENDDTIVAAVGSLLDQDVSVEVVVSHSGGGDTPRLLAQAFPSLRVLAGERRRLPGEARNVGVAATSAPWVAFLEGDSFAAPGWASARLARHRAGAAAVSGAVVPDTHAPAALAAHLQRNSMRLPHMPAPPAHLRYTVSLARELLGRVGPFPENLARSEDTVLNNRLAAAGVDVEWAPEVVLVTSCPQTVRELCREQLRRGRVWGSLTGGWAWRLVGALQAPADAVAGLVRALRAGSPIPRMAVARALPHLLLCAGATAIGRALAGSPPPGADLPAVNAGRRAPRLPRRRAPDTPHAPR